jgi:hypothetical protein
MVALALPPGGIPAGLDLLGRVAVAAVLAPAAVLKLADLPGLRGTLYLSRLTRSWVSQLTVALPVAELALAAALLGVSSGFAAAAASASLLIAFIVFLAADRTAGQGCNCFGRRSSSSRRVGIWRNVGLLGCLLPTVLRGAGADRPGVPLAVEPAAALGAVAVIAALLARAFRSDARRRAGPGGSAVAPSRGRRRSGRATVPSPPVPRVAPDFELPVLTGGRVRLADLLAGSTPGAARTLLVFVEPGCVSCEAVLPPLVGRSDALVVAAGAPADVAQLADRHRLSRVAIDADGAVADAYRARATPSACLLDDLGIFRDSDGIPTARLAVGRAAVDALSGALRAGRPEGG